MKSLFQVRTMLVATFFLAVLSNIPCGNWTWADEPKIKPIRALLVLGGCCHDYVVQKEILSKGISERAHVEVVIAFDTDKSTSHLNPVYESPTWANGFDVVIHDECSA